MNLTEVLVWLSQQPKAVRDEVFNHLKRLNQLENPQGDKPKKEKPKKENKDKPYFHPKKPKHFYLKPSDKIICNFIKAKEIQFYLSLRVKFNILRKHNNIRFTHSREHWSYQYPNDTHLHPPHLPNMHGSLAQNIDCYTEIQENIYGKKKEFHFNICNVLPYDEEIDITYEEFERRYKNPEVKPEDCKDYGEVILGMPFNIQYYLVLQFDTVSFFNRFKSGSEKITGKSWNIDINYTYIKDGERKVKNIKMVCDYQTRIKLFDTDKKEIEGFENEIRIYYKINVIGFPLLSILLHLFLQYPQDDFLNLLLKLHQ